MTAAQLAHLRLPPSSNDADAAAASFFAARLASLTSDEAQTIDDLLNESTAEHEELRQQVRFLLHANSARLNMPEARLVYYRTR